MNDTKVSKLAAIMFTDIAGYSSMMERDENMAMKVIDDHNRILLPIIAGSGGRTIDAIGDGLLVVFDSVYSACNCALNIQGAVASRNESVPETARFLLRIGIHMGDIWQDGERIFGNGVNIAARLLPFAEPGGICVSDDVHRQLRNKTDARFEHLGQKNLKNIEQPVVCHRLVTGYERPEESPGGTDVVQEKLARELEKLREKRIADRLGSGRGREDGTGFESSLERRITGFVENVIDKALEKWESVPAEKRAEMIGSIKKEDWYSDAHFSIASGKVNIKKDGEEKESKEDWRELIPVGVVATAGFGAALVWFNALWLVFPLVFIGLMPLGIGISHFLTRRRGAGKKGVLPPAERERLVFEAAVRRGGRLSVMQMSAESGMALDESQAVLDEMAKRGYIGQEIDDNGLITYVFPDLLPGKGGA